MQPKKALTCEQCGMEARESCTHHAPHKPAGVDQRSWDVAFGIGLWISRTDPRGTLGEIETIARALAREYGAGSPK